MAKNKRRKPKVAPPPMIRKEKKKKFTPITVSDIQQWKHDLDMAGIKSRGAGMTMLVSQSMLDAMDKRMVADMKLHSAIKVMGKLKNLP